MSKEVEGMNRLVGLLFLSAALPTQAAEITLLDLWKQHLDWLIALSVLLFLLTAALVRMGWQRRQLRLVEQSLRLEKQHLADVIWGTHVGTWEWNVQTGDVLFNERWAEMAGYRLDELSPVNIDTWLKLAKSKAG